MFLPALPHREGVGLAVSGLWTLRYRLAVSEVMVDELMGASVVPMAKVFTDDAGGSGCGWRGYDWGHGQAARWQCIPQGGWVGMVKSVADGGKRWLAIACSAGRRAER